HDSQAAAVALCEIIAAGVRDDFEQRFEAAARGVASGVFRTMGLHADGHTIDLSATLAPLQLENGEAGVAFIARDVSARRREEDEASRVHEEPAEREAALRRAPAALRKAHEALKRTQLQLVQSAKLESVGRLAAGVAHEVKNPLAMILAGTEFLLSQHARRGDPAVEPVLIDIRAAVERASAVIHGLLNYSASTELRLTAASLDETIEQS